VLVMEEFSLTIISFQGNDKKKNELMLGLANKRDIVL